MATSWQAPAAPCSGRSPGRMPSGSGWAEKPAWKLMLLTPVILTEWRPLLWVCEQSKRHLLRAGEGEGEGQQPAPSTRSDSSVPIRRAPSTGEGQGLCELLLLGCPSRRGQHRGPGTSLP